MEDYNHEQLIQSIDSEFVMDSITEQFTNKLTNIITTNYMRDVINACDNCEDEDYDGTDVRTICEHVFSELTEAYDIDFDDIISESNLAQMQKVAKTVYEFFIKNYKENLRMFIVNYIIQNTESIAKNIEFDDNNVSYISLVNEYPEIDKSNLKLLISTANAVRYVCNSLVDIDDYCSLISEHADSDSDVKKMIKLIESGIIDVPDDIVTRLCMPVLNKHSGSSILISEIQSELYTNIIN